MTEWMRRGACLGHDPELFFPDPGGNAQAEEARRVCLGCPVRHNCLQHALEHHLCGVWGATTDLERKQFRYDARNARRRALRAERNAA